MDVCWWVGFGKQGLSFFDDYYYFYITYMHIYILYTVIFFNQYTMIYIYNYMSLNTTCIKFTGSSSPWLQKHTSSIAWAYIINVFISFFMIYTHISLYSSGSLYFSSTLLCAEAFWHYIDIYIYIQLEGIWRSELHKLQAFLSSTRTQHKVYNIT